MKLWKWLFFFTLLTAAAGCQLDSREIDHRTMVLGMAIDKTEEGEFIVTVQVPVIVPTEGQLGPSEFETLTQTGATVWEAISNIEAMTPTVLFFGHLKTVMFGETLAREGIGQVLDMLDRRAPLANQVLLLIIRNRIEADKFLSQESPLVNLPALYIERFFKADQKLSRSTDVKLFQYRRDSNLKGNAGLIPLAYSDRENIFIEDMAVIHKGKLVGELVGKEAGISQLLKEEAVENMNYTTKLKQEGMEVTTSVRINAEMNVDISKTTPAEITLDIAGEGELVHISEYHFETTERHLDELTKQLELEMKKDIEQAIDDMKKINVEPWFLGQRIWVEDREYYNSLHWEDAGWREAAVKINVAVEMEQTGQKSMLDKKKIGD